MTDTDDTAPASKALAKMAQRLLSELKGTVGELRTAELEDNGDAAWDLMRDAAEWAMTIPGHPGDAHGAYLMVLREPIDDDEAELMLRLLLRIDGVLAVEPVEEGWTARSPEVTIRIATRRVQQGLAEVLEEALDGHWHMPRPRPERQLDPRDAGR